MTEEANLLPDEKKYMWYLETLSFCHFDTKLKRLCQEEKYSKSNRLERRYFQFSVLDDFKK